MEAFARPIVYFLILYFCLSSCLHRGERIEKELGVVVSKNLTPGYYHTYTTYERHYYGRSYRGRQQSITVPQEHSYYVPPVYTITFKCQHEKVFDIHREDIYNLMSILDTVTIEFYNLLDGEERVKDYDFVTAYKGKRW